MTKDFNKPTGFFYEANLLSIRMAKELKDAQFHKKMRLVCAGISIVSLIAFVLIYLLTNPLTLQGEQSQLDHLRSFVQPVFWFGILGYIISGLVAWLNRRSQIEKSQNKK